LGPFWSGRFGLRGLFSTFIGAVLAMGRFGRFPYGTLGVDGWAVTFGTARRGLGGAAARPGLRATDCTKCNSPPIIGQCTNFVLST